MSASQQLTGSRKLPMLPGMSFPDLERTNFRKSQQFGYLNGMPTVKGDAVGKEKTDAPSYLTKCLQGLGLADENGEAVPSWVAFDRKVLRFYGYFKEPVHESRLESYRVRKLVLLYHLEDDSIHVAEPRVENSGIPQGDFLKRHKVPKGDPSDKQFYNLEDLNVGINLDLYGRVIRLVDCDQFTRNLYEKLGIKLNESEGVAEDPYTVQRELSKGNQRTKQGPGPDALSKFLENDRKVLRFYLYWDDRESLYGEMRSFILNYFLADDTVEVLEKHDNNNGRDPFPALVKRMKLPKKTASAIGEPVDCYSQEDLRIGNVVNVFNRHMVIYDCDKFTRDYYAQHFGITDFEPIHMQAPEHYIPRMPIPPHNGFGSEEDSISNFLHLVPKAPKADFKKMMDFDGKVLRYVCKLANGTEQDEQRRFIISYFLTDDTLSVFEPPVRNSGILGGKFLERQRVKDPSDPLGGFYAPKSFHVGVTVKIFGHEFSLIEADEFTLSYMEGRPREFPLSDIHMIHHQLRAQVAQSSVSLLDHFKRVDRDGSGAIDCEEFGKLLESLHIIVPKQSLITLWRRYDTDRSGTIQYGEFLTAIGSEHVPTGMDSRDDAVHQIGLEKIPQPSNIISG